MELIKKHTSFLGANIYFNQDEMLLIANALRTELEEVKDEEEHAFRQYKETNDESDREYCLTLQEQLKQINQLVEEIENIINQ